MASKGYSLIELIMIIVTLGLLAAFSISSFGSANESRDAATIQSAQATLQSVVSQGALRMSVTPKMLRDQYSSQILPAIQAAVLQKNTNVNFSQIGNQFLMTIQNTGRTALFSIDDNGNVQLSSLGCNPAHPSCHSFTTYTVQNAAITKMP